MGDRRWSNPTGLKEYAARVASGQDSSGEEVLSARTRLEEMVMLSLRTSQGLDLEKFKATTKAEFPWRHPAVEQLRSSGMACLRAGHLQLTRKGMLVSNSVIEMMLGILDRMHKDTV
jgi:oxygen-independent coproporphyrinogen-3 oxidase